MHDFRETDCRLQEFLDKCSILNECQYGFRKNKSTNLALLELVEEICK